MRGQTIPKPADERDAGNRYFVEQFGSPTSRGGETVAMVVADDDFLVSRRTIEKHIEQS